jgi:hypothetical protein
MSAPVATTHKAVELHLPSRDRHGEPIDRGPWVDLAIGVMCDAFGGAYEETVVGHWVAPAHARVREETSRLVSYADDRQIAEGLPRVLDVAARFMEATDQEVVMVAVDGQPHRVPAPAGCHA